VAVVGREKHLERRKGTLRGRNLTPAERTGNFLREPALQAEEHHGQSVGGSMKKEEGRKEKEGKTRSFRHYKKEGTQKNFILYRRTIWGMVGVSCRRAEKGNREVLVPLGGEKPE